jgi:hypothetical protein
VHKNVSGFLYSENVAIFAFCKTYMAMSKNFFETLVGKINYLKRVKTSIMVYYKRQKKKNKGAGAFGIILVVIVSAAALFGIWKLAGCSNTPEMGFDAAIKNYGSEIKFLAKQFDLDPNFLMALVMLECSGRKDVPARFEPGVYNKLKEVQEHRRASLESITEIDIADANDDAIRNLASSWGPFQLMGYKCLHLGIKIKDLRGNRSLYYGVMWIDKTYGDYVRKGRFEDAFHIHNTGRPVPKSGKYLTYDPKYVPNGMSYMQYFKEHF